MDQFNDFLLPNEPLKYNDDELTRLLVHCTKLKASDIKIQTNGEIYTKIHGHVCRITRRALPPTEVENILAIIYGTNGPSMIKSGRDVDKSLELHPSRAERYRFRVNAVGGTVNGMRGMEITLRTIDITPPKFAALNLEPGLVKGMFPIDGIVFVAGMTGSGKSTLLASGVADILERPDANKFIVTYEAPIEYVYDEINKPSSRIWQTEIGPASDLPDFAAGIRNALRRAPDIILLGETRDIETVEGSLAASQSGHTVYTTLHANNGVDCFRRVVNYYPPSARSGVMNNLVSSVRMVVWQRLFIRADGKGRVAIREYLEFTDDVREELLLRGAENMDAMLVHMRKLFRERGQTAAVAAQRAYDEGLLKAEDLLAVTASGAV